MKKDKLNDTEISIGGAEKDQIKETPVCCLIVCKTVNTNRNRRRKFFNSAMRKQMGKLLNSKDFDDGQKIGSGKTLRRWGSPCNGRRSFHKLADLDDRLKLQEQVTVSPVVLKAVLHFTESPSLRSNEDVPSSEYIVTVAATDARIFQEPVDDVGSTVNGLEGLEEAFAPICSFDSDSSFGLRCYNFNYFVFELDKYL
ncbi:uncharacterized protein LOC127902683 isoform X2 [Citrus sinensis]|uniref:uncharacterized protein LOC112098268 isoform X2 n=1 Tax=Citrus clementina TaxID=85681 RepID=UPI000CED38FA|nr:uncharacterized protein LOC112098268 isoform X2 [Citrus x clementina]XP_052298405.1 uncharacterized protein LOC127902683 isoform X2 [Citrus sinensis]